MAVLNKPPASSGLDLGDTCPAGTYVATCIDVIDEFGVQRRKFQSEETETCDVTRFVFGVRDAAGKPFKVATQAMKQSGHEKSALYKFLYNWLGKAPVYGWDYCEMKGQKALISVVHKEGNNGAVFANIASIMPAPAGGFAAPAAPPPPPPPPLNPPPIYDHDDVPF